MFYVWVTLLVIINASFLVLNFFALPGNWFMIALTGLFAWWQSDNSPFSIYVLIVAVVLAVAGEIVEFIAGPGGARKAGASIKGAIGAILGTIVGAMAGTVIIPIPLIGTIIGAAGGACMGTALVEFSTGKKLDHSFKSGLGASVGVLFGTGGKFLIGVLIWMIITIAAFVR